METFTLHLPQTLEVPIVANLPHSGLQLPDAVAAQFYPEIFQSLPHTDWHLDRLYRFLPDLGVTLLQANYSRYCVDLNRSPQEPFGSFWRAVIPAETAFGKPIYQQQPTGSQVQERIEQFYLPYHQKLTALLQEKVERFGKVYLLDLHSFLGLVSEQICLGNVDGRSCSETTISIVERQFRQQGYQVVRNKVFKGGYITRHYGELPNVEALQVEIRYTVYLKPEQLEKDQPPDWQVLEFEAAQQKFMAVFTTIVSDLSSVVQTSS